MVLTRVRIPRRALGREVHILLLAAHPVTRPSWLIAVMGYEEAGLLLIPPHPHAGSGHRAGLSRSDADGLVLSGGTPKTDVQPGSPPLRKERSQPPSGRPAATGLVPLMQTGRHDVPRTRLFEGSNPSRDTGVCEDMWRDHSHNPPRRRRPRLQALFFTRPAPAPFARIILRMVRLNAGSTPAPGTHAGMRQSVSRRTKTVQYGQRLSGPPAPVPGMQGSNSGRRP